MKPWAADIERHIRDWSARLGNLWWWPRYVYHFTDVRNAASIIRIGQLCSRAEVQRRNLMQIDNASPEIIHGTRPDHLQYARFYFRPRTPTQYRNEGIRPAAERQTPLHLLPANQRAKWATTIRLGREGLFERRWTFVEEVVVVDDVVTFRFNPSTKTPGPFQVQFSYSEDGSSEPRVWEGQVQSLNEQFTIRVKNAEWGVAKLFLDDALAFEGWLVFTEIPF